MCLNSGLNVRDKKMIQEVKSKKKKKRQKSKNKQKQMRALSCSDMKMDILARTLPPLAGPYCFFLLVFHVALVMSSRTRIIGGGQRCED